MIDSGAVAETGKPAAGPCGTFRCCCSRCRSAAVRGLKTHLERGGSVREARREDEAATETYQIEGLAIPNVCLPDLAKFN